MRPQREINGQWQEQVLEGPAAIAPAQDRFALSVATPVASAYISSTPWLGLPRNPPARCWHREPDCFRRSGGAHLRPGASGSESSGAGLVNGWTRTWPA